jgi:signal transduction histidine kinase
MARDLPGGDRPVGGSLLVPQSLRRDRSSPAGHFFPSLDPREVASSEAVPDLRPPATDRDVLEAFAHRMGSPLGAVGNLVHVATSGGDVASVLAPLERSFTSVRTVFRGLQRWIDAVHRAPEHPEEVDVAALAGEAARRRLGLRAPAVLGGPSPARVRPGALARVLVEVLDNVERHGGRVLARVEASRRDGLVRLALDDRGPGWPAEGPEPAFRPFARAGAGVGLAIVRALAAAEGGGAFGEAAPEGGARVVVLLPAVP